MSCAEALSPCTISVVVPVYRHVAYLPTAIASALAQSHAPLEVLVVDDGSPEDVASVLTPFQHLPAIRLMRQTNAGVSAARNAALRVAKGHWVAFLDHDDVWEPAKLQLQLEALQLHPAAALCHTGARYIDADGRPTRIEPEIAENVQGSCWPRLLLGNPVLTSSVLLRRDLALALGGFDWALRHAEDYDLWLRVAREAEFCYVDEPLVRYRVHGGGASARTAAILAGTLDVVDRHVAGAPATFRARVDAPALRLRRARLHAALSRHHFEAERWTAFVRHWLASARWDRRTAFDLGLPPAVVDRLRWYAMRAGL